METAHARPPRASPARPRARRAVPIAVALALVAAAASAILLQPFGGFHLLPGKSLPRPTIAAAVSTPPSIPVDQLAARLVAPPRPAPAAIAALAVELPLATSGTLPSGGRLEQVAVKAATVVIEDKPFTPPVPAIAAPAMQQPGSLRALPLPAISEREAVSAAVAAALAGPATLPLQRPSPALGPPPTPREPLPLETDLINPPAPTATPDAGVTSGGRPAAGDPHG